MNPEGVNIRACQFSVKEAVHKLQVFLKNHGATIYARIDQQLEARNVGLDLSPLEFLMFGNPKGGAPAMADNPLVALDLPLKIIAWEDDENKVWLAYNKATYIEERYSFAPNANSPFVLDHIIDEALKQ